MTSYIFKPLNRFYIRRTALEPILGVDVCRIFTAERQQ